MESINRNPKSSEKWGLIGVVCFLVGIVVFPISKAYWPIERARWFIAAADNAREISTEAAEGVQEAEELLEKARSSYPEIENTFEFALVRSRMPPDEDTDRAIKSVLSISPKYQVDVANKYAESRLKVRDFDAAYKILVACYPSPAARTPAERNQVSYYAALADRDLEAALSEIEAALSDAKYAAFLDTKAWVLFRLGRFDEALTFIDQAIHELDLNLKAATLPASVRAKIQDLYEGTGPFVKRPLKDKSNPFESLNQDLAQSLSPIVVLRYHRGEILEALGKTEEADKEYTWVQERGFNDFDRLY